MIARISKFFGTDISRLAQGSIWLTVGTVSGTLISLLLSIAYARYLSKETYGDYRFILQFLNIFGIFALSGIGSSVTRSVARGFETTFRRGTWIMFFSSLFITLAAIGAALYFILVEQKPHIGYGFFAVALFIPFLEGMGTWRGYMDSKKQFRNKTLYNIFFDILFGVFMGMAVFIITRYNVPTIWSVSLLLLAYYISQAIPNIFMFQKIVRQIPANSAEEPGAIRYGVHLSVSNIPATIATYLDGILIHALLGPASLAVYSFAIALPEQIKGVFSNAVTVVTPDLSKKTLLAEDTQRLKKTLPLKMFKSSLVTGALAVGYIICAPFIYTIFFPNYIDAVIYSQVFAAALIFFPFGVLGTALKVEGDTKKVYAYTIIPPLIQIVMLVLLIPPFGLWGAIVARILGRLLMYLLGLFLFIA
jgi:O-antigen/teichoic acid export membrane protein